MHVLVEVVCVKDSMRESGPPQVVIGWVVMASKPDYRMIGGERRTVTRSQGLG